MSRTTVVAMILALGALASGPASAGLVVVDAAGEPVTGAAVEVRTLPDGSGVLAQMVAPVKRAQSGAGGTADVVLPALETLVSIDHPDFAPWSAEVLAGEAPARIELGRGRILAGRLVSAATGEEESEEARPERPWEGTACASWRSEWPRWGVSKTWRRCGTVGEKGDFEIQGLAASERFGGPIELSIDAPGYLPAVRELSGEALARPLRVEMIEGVALTGIVQTVNGERLAGARVRDASGGGEVGSSRDGTFVLAIEALPVTLHVSAPGMRSASVRVRKVASARAPVVVELAPAERVSGFVLGDDGAALAEADLAWEVSVEGRRESGRIVMDLEEGSFAVDLPRPGMYWLSIEAEGYREEPLGEIAVGAGATIDVGVIELSRGGGVRGSVVDAENGEAVAGVSVTLVPAGAAVFQAADDRLPAAVSDEEGRFALLGVAGGRYELRARHEGYAPYIDAVTVRKDEAEELEVLALDRGAALRVRLVDRSGEPRSGLGLQVRDREAEVLLPVAEGRSDAQGWVEGLTLGAGRYRVEVTGERLLLAQELEVAAGEDEVELELAVGGVDLSGWVLRAGEAVAGGTLTLSSALDPAEARGKLVLRTTDGRSATYGLSESAVSGVVSQSGMFRIEDAPAGVVRATWSAGGTTVERELLVPDVARVEVEIELGGLALHGRVVTEDGVAVPGAEISVIDATGRLVGRTRSRESGGFTIGDLAGGRYSVEASAEGFTSTVRSDVVVKEESVPLRIALRPGSDGELDVALMRADGSPLAGHLVSLLDGTGRVVRSLVADERGHRRFEALPGGDYFVVWSDPLSGVGHAPAIRILGGADGESEVVRWSRTLPEGGDLVLECRRPVCEGAPVELLTVHSETGVSLGWALPGMSAGLRLSSTGLVALGRLAPGTYQVGLWVGGHRWLTPVDVGSGSVARVIFD